VARNRQLQQEIPLLYGIIYQHILFMVIKPWLLLSAACLLALAACDDCRNVECADGDYKALVFQSKADGADLILGGVYSLDSLRIVPILIDPTKPGARVRINLEYQNALIWADNNTAGYIIQLDSLPPDTLLATVGPSVTDQCCGSVTEFKTLTLNGLTVPSDYTVCCVIIQK